MAIREGNDDGFGYRSPVTQAAPKPQYSQDEANINTLQNVLIILDAQIAGLSKDFNAFDILKLMENSDTLSAAQQKLMVQILGKQNAYDILMEAREAIDGAINRANTNYQQRNS